MNNKISCSHLLSSLTVHCSYRLKFFVVRDHLWDGNSHNCCLLPLEALEGLLKYTEGVARRIAMRRSSPECEEVLRYSLQN